MKRLNWSPDIIYLHGWFTSLFPLYLKKLYADEPIFENSKIVSSLYSNAFSGSLSKKLVEKIHFDGIDMNLDLISEPDFIALSNLMVKLSDSVVLSSENIDKQILTSIKDNSKDFLSFEEYSIDDKLINFLLKNTG